MNVLGARATAAFGSQPDIRAWSRTTPLDPARITPEQRSPAVDDAVERLRRYADAGVARLLTELSGAPALLSRVGLERSV